MFKALLIGLILSNGADVGTSLYGFKYGAVEQNPFVYSTKPAPFIAQAAVFTTVECLIFHEFNKTHPRLAKTLAIAGIAVETGLAVHNTRIGNELRQGR